MQVPGRIRTLARQLSHAGITSRGYTQRMRRPCRHPTRAKLGTVSMDGLPVFGLDVYNNGWWHQ